MSEFIQRLALFLSLPAIFLAPTVAFFVVSGEIYSLPNVEKLSRGSRTTLFSTAYSNFHPQLQTNEVVVRKPQVLVLGSSRVGVFRDAFFKNPEVFYNATGAVVTMADFNTFLKAIMPHKPHIVIAGMDQYYFNPKKAKNNAVRRENTLLSNPLGSYGILLVDSIFRNGGWWKVYHDYGKGKFTLAKALHNSESATVIGLRARAVGSGSINDGSDYYGELIHSTTSQQAVLRSIDKLAGSISQSNGDEYGSDISADALTELRGFLAYSKANGIFVIGFLPPVSHAVYERLGNYSDASYSYSFHNLDTVLASVYEEYGFDFYDFSDITSFGSSDNEMVEARHGSEKMYLRLFIIMAEKSRPLSALVDTAFLRKGLESAASAYVVFPPSGI